MRFGNRTARTAARIISRTPHATAAPAGKERERDIEDESLLHSYMRVFFFASFNATWILHLKS